MTPTAPYQDFDAQAAADPRNQVPLGEDQAAGRVTPTAAQDTVGETEKSPQLQPGNRRSIKEYLSDIRALREQMKAQGVPEDQLPVPTFTNIQGGQMDVSQGQLEVGPGGMGQREVRSYMEPEWQAPQGGSVPTEMGSAHPVKQRLTMLKQQSPALQSVMSALNNDLDPRWADAVAFDTIDDWMIGFNEQTGRWPSDEETKSALFALRKQAFEEQGKLISQLKKEHKDADYQSLLKAYQTGDWSYAEKKGPEMLSQEKFGKIHDEAMETWTKMRDENNAAPLRDDGEPFTSAQEYAQFKVQQYQESVQNMFRVMQEMSKYKGGPQTEQRPTGGPQTGGRQYQEPQAGGGLPPEAAAKLKQGVITTFGNGQKWTLDQNGQPKKVQ
jgi:hypothetical protein